MNLSSPLVIVRTLCISKVQNRFQYFNRLVYDIISVNEIMVFNGIFKLKP